MNQLLYFLVFLLLIPLLFSFWVEGLSLIASILDLPALKWFGFGLLVSVFIGGLSNGAVARFIETAIHELTHASVGTPFAGDVTYMEASSKTAGVAGATRFNGGCNPLFPFIALAPYYFPLLTVPFLLAEPFAAHFSATAKQVVDLLIGSTLGFHYVMCAKQFRFYQKDLEQVGFIVSIGMTFTLMLIWLVIILTVVLGEYSSILDFFIAAFAHAPEYYREVFAWLQSLQSGP